MVIRNLMLTGFVLGLIFPGLTLLLFNVLYKNVLLLNKPAIPYLVALGLNLFIIRICYKKGADQTGRGVMLATFIAMLIMFFLFKIRLS
ncbi:hypothetical protein ACFQ3S_11080 [Mucilaginibacter terrae]|uniref:hypothetical protein n=1 Tax=Mucilaginibacter terrae TaxID=1955052 RepID=UPI0036427E49